MSINLWGLGIATQSIKYFCACLCLKILLLAMFVVCKGGKTAREICLLHREEVVLPPAMAAKAAKCFSMFLSRLWNEGLHLLSLRWNRLCQWVMEPHALFCTFRFTINTKVTGNSTTQELETSVPLRAGKVLFEVISVRCS